MGKDGICEDTEMASAMVKRLNELIAEYGDKPMTFDGGYGDCGEPVYDEHSDSFTVS